ncbi:MAG: hydroxymethylbilane synthase [Proteobacteria bacterium]|nr:hydroxymethylbilane synthase [Pseudomonadota bacterium]
MGTRGSALALCQTNRVKERLEERYPHLSFQVVTIKTTGDKITDVPLAKVGGKGLFVKEIEEALLERRIDLAVHSMKDLPGVLPPDLILGAITKREDPRDIFISRKEKYLKRLPRGARIGTSSLRRQSQLLSFRPDFIIDPLRGNLDTRIKRLETSKLDGIIVAAAGIIRMGWKDKITQYLPATTILPAIGQGALGIETRRDDAETNKLIFSLNHLETSRTVGAERAFLKRLEGGCQVPIAGFGMIEKGLLSLEGLIGSLDGKVVVRDRIEGVPEEAERMGIALAEKLLSEGGRVILEELEVTG